MLNIHTLFYSDELKYIMHVNIIIDFFIDIALDWAYQQLFKNYYSFGWKRLYTNACYAANNQNTLGYPNAITDHFASNVSIKWEC